MNTYEKSFAANETAATSSNLDINVSGNIETSTTSEERSLGASLNAISGSEEEGAQKTYTQKEVEAMIQREADRRVSKALSTQKKEYEKKLSLSALDADKRQDAEKDMRIAELEQQIADYEIEKNRSELKSVLSARGLSAEFADLIAITDDKEESQQRIDKLDKLIKAQVAAGVRAAIASSAPSTGATRISEKRFSDMTIAEKQALYNRDPAEYARLRDIH